MLSQQEYEYLARRAAFEALLAGQRREDLDRLLDLEPGNRSYALALFAVPAGADRLRDTLAGHFLKYPEYILLPWGVGEYLVILRDQPADLPRCISRCVGAIADSFAAFGVADWHAAVTPPVDSLEALPECYRTLSRLWAHRYMLAGEHLLTRDTIVQYTDEEEWLLGLDASAADPRQLRQIMEQSAAGDVPGAVARLLEEWGNALESENFCRYLALSCRFCAVQFAAGRGYLPRAFIQSSHLEFPTQRRITAAVLEDYLVRVLRAAIRCRDTDGVSACRGVLRRAAAYVDAHYSREGLSLEQVAAAVELSPNYLSALFRRELDCTFVEYMTRRRMERARELLETTGLRSGEVARAVGYRDPRYFSSLFKKHQGMTPREYRTSKKNADG